MIFYYGVHDSHHCYPVVKGSMMIAVGVCAKGKTMTEKPKTDEDADPRDRTIGGVLLIVLGIFVLLQYLFPSTNIGQLILPGLGVMFLIWGVLTHRFGLMIPGCILTGLGGALLITQAMPPVEGTVTGGIFVLGLALAFVAMSLISPYFLPRRELWPLVPAAILGVIGILLVVANGLWVLEQISLLWPFVLIILGVLLLLGPRLRHQ